jgi:hypothetical protein
MSVICIQKPSTHTHTHTKITYVTEIRSVLVTNNQVGDRLSSLTTTLGNHNRVDRLGRRVGLLGLLGSNLNTTRSSLDGNSLKKCIHVNHIKPIPSIHSFWCYFSSTMTYLFVGETRVLERVEVGQVGGFRRKLETITLHEEGVVVLDQFPNQSRAHFL